jgi:hypothetical protein
MKKELHRTKRGFHVVEYRNDLERIEYQVRNWRGTVMTTRRALDQAVKRADALEQQAVEKENRESHHGE